jgi:signal transduction histidine kinase
MDQVIQAYLEQVAARGQFTCSVALYEFDNLGERTAVNVRGRWSPQSGLEALDQRLPYSRDSLDPLLDAGETIMITNVHTDPRVSEELRQIQTESGRPALVLIPLLVRQLRIGLVVLSAPYVHAWSTTDLRPFQATAALLATMLDNRRQQQLLFARSQQIGVLEERQRLARELHDSVTQLIFSITLIAQSVDTAWKRDPVEAQRRLDRLVELSRDALAEMRALLHELLPANGVVRTVTPDTVLPGIVRLQSEGLVPTLKHHFANLIHDGVRIQFETDGYVSQTLAHEEALYRITQEALNNVIKHSHASSVRIDLAMNTESVLLSVEDNGDGFEPNRKSRGGMGLDSMRERAVTLGGSFQISSERGKGTNLQVTIPRKDDKRWLTNPSAS